MAEIFRPTYSVTDPKTGKRVKRKSRTWHIRYYLPNGKRVRMKGHKDKAATQALARELERKAARLQEGIIDPTDEHGKKPLAEHLADYQAHLAAKRDTAEHVAKSKFRIETCLDSCRFINIGDVQSFAVMGFLAELRNKGLAVKTANDYLAAVKGFTRWLWRDKRSLADPLAGLSRLANGQTDVSHPRRDFSADELQRLLDAARQSRRRLRKLHGTDRYFLYLTASATGFRAAELASLTPAALDLDADPPTATVDAADSKNRKEAVQPIPRDVAAALAGYLQNKPKDKPIWPGRWVAKGFLIIQADLKTARETWLAETTDPDERAERERSDFLAYVDADGRFADFHSLRHTFVTRVVQSGASPKVAQTLARHSTVQLTLGRYAHTGMYDLAAAVDALPPLLGTEPAQVQLSATGTDGKTGKASKGQKFLGPNLGPQTAKMGDFRGFQETEAEKAGQTKNPGKQAGFAVFQGSNEGNEKVEVRGFEPLTF